MITQTESLNARGLETSRLLTAYRQMALTRALDEAETRLRRHRKTFFEVSAAGHEAVQAAAAMLLRAGQDWFFPYYRDRTLCLGLGVPAADMIRQAMGKSSDPSSGGRQMPCHYGSLDLNIVSQSSPTGTQYLQAVGVAEGLLLSRKIGREGADQTGALVYVSGGEGSTSNGEFYEAISAASTQKLPVLFVIQDNGYAISVPVDHQTPGGNISALFSGYPNLFVEEVDGVDLLESHRVLRRATRHVRRGLGPALVHAHVVRLWSHSDSDDDRQYRPAMEKEADQSRDPIRLLEELLVGERHLSEDRLLEIREELKLEVEQAIELASASPDPAASSAEQFLFNPEPVATAELEPLAEGPALTMVEAINRTLEDEMRRDRRVVVLGEDVADASRSEHLAELAGKGGVFKVTHNLQRKLGDHRVYNTPLAEAGIVGRAVGLAIQGLVPVAEIQFFDFIWPAMQQIRNELGFLRWRSNNSFSAPVVLRAPIGGYLSGAGPYHSQSGESIFCHSPGLRVVYPSCARDAVGLLRTAIRCGDPVLFLEHKHLYRQSYARSPYPGSEYAIPLGCARTARVGRDVTVITYGALVEKSLRAADELAESGIEAEVIDLRSLAPYDWDTIAASVRRTSRAVIVHEDSRTHGFGAEIAARIGEELFAELDAPVGRVGSRDIPVGYSPVLEEATLPQVPEITASIRRACAF